MFQRGLDVKEALGLGEFAPMVKELRQFFEENLMRKSSPDIWSTSNSWTPAPGKKITDEVICKNFPDAGGGNVNKFIVWLHQMNDTPISSDDIKSAVWRIRSDFNKFNCSIKAMNYYRTEKFKRKYDLPLDRKGLIIEIIYTKNK